MAACPIVEAPTPQELAELASGLRERATAGTPPIDALLDAFEKWSGDLARSPAAPAVAGAAFLCLWLRRATLAPILARELPGDGWTERHGARVKPFPVGVIGHFPAGNIEIQPLLSMTCSLLGGNAALVRIPTGLVDATRHLVESLPRTEGGRRVAERIALVSFEHASPAMDAMARVVDGAMIWGGRDAVERVRSLPFPPWARLAVFGPRISVAAMDRGSWVDPARRAGWCRALARDLWQFDQQACSSPQALFVEARDAEEAEPLVASLASALEQENRAHPRQRCSPAMTSAIVQARASWLLDDVARRARFPATPDWTLLVGRGPTMSDAIQGRTLTVLTVDDIVDAVRRLDGNVQTLGLAMCDPAAEQRVADLAGARGVDRIVKLGRMHLFDSPWDGAQLIAPMVRWVRHLPASQPAPTPQEETPGAS